VNECNIVEYSVLMSVYYKDNPEWLKKAIDSMLNQTKTTNDFVIIKDGELTEELNNTIVNYQKDINQIKKTGLKVLRNSQGKHKIIVPK